MATKVDIEHHYDAYDQIILNVIDPEFHAYSTAHWGRVDSLVEAQRRKFDYIAEKINLAACSAVLEIGSGWGSFAKYCSNHAPHVSITGLTLSSAQKTFVDQQSISNFKCELSDWKEYRTSTIFDAIVAIESFEHFASMEERKRGQHIEIYKRFFEFCRDLSADDAALYIQSSIARSGPDDLQGTRDALFLLEQVFPGSALPTISNLQLACHGIYEFEELQLRRADTVRTFEAWQARFAACKGLIERDFGLERAAWFQRYFDATVRRFSSGHVDLLELTLAKQRLV